MEICRAACICGIIKISKKLYSDIFRRKGQPNPGKSLENACRTVISCRCSLQGLKATLLPKMGTAGSAEIRQAVTLQALALYCTLEKQRGIYYATIRDIARSKKRQTLPAGS